MLQDNTFHKSKNIPHFETVARFAPVVPLELAKQMQEAGTLGNYHLLLAHDVLDKPEEYALVYANRGYTILMDNSLIELGYAMPLEKVAEAARVVGAQYIILPDTLSNASETVVQVDAAVDAWNSLPYERKEGLSLIAVVQGANHREQVTCLQYFRSLPIIKGVCVPRVIADTCQTRKWMIQEATKYYNVHLLGFSENFLDDIACARMPGVIGIDSAVPIRLGLRGLTVSLDDPQDAGKRECYWDNPYGLERTGISLLPWTQEVRLSLVNYNLTNIRGFLSK